LKGNSRSLLSWTVLGVFAFAAGCGGASSFTPPPPPPPEVITITNDTNVQCVQTVPFSITLQAQGASSALTWSITSGQLPIGLALDPSSGTISGTPLAGSGVLVTIQAADGKATASKQFNFLVWTKLTINPVTPAPAHLNAPYSLSFTAQASSGIASWTIAAGQLPPGLS